MDGKGDRGLREQRRSGKGPLSTAQYSNHFTDNDFEDSGLGSQISG